MSDCPSTSLCRVFSFSHHPSRPSPSPLTGTLIDRLKSFLMGLTVIYERGYLSGETTEETTAVSVKLWCTNTITLISIMHIMEMIEYDDTVQWRIRFLWKLSVYTHTQKESCRSCFGKIKIVFLYHSMHFKDLIFLPRCGENVGVSSPW